MEVLSSMQELLNNWGSLMEVTGEALRTEKSCYYLVDYVLKIGKLVATDTMLYLELVAPDMNGEIVTLSHLRCDEATEILGLWMAPDGNRK